MSCCCLSLLSLLSRGTTTFSRCIISFQSSSLFLGAIRSQVFIQFSSFWRKLFCLLYRLLHFRSVKFDAVLVCCKQLLLFYLSLSCFRLWRSRCHLLLVLSLRRDTTSWLFCYNDSLLFIVLLLDKPIHYFSNLCDFHRFHYYLFVAQLDL